jgi:hypothetical protein
MIHVNIVIMFSTTYSTRYARRHYRMAHPQIASGGDELRVWIAAVNLRFESSVAQSQNWAVHQLGGRVGD